MDHTEYTLLDPALDEQHARSNYEATLLLVQALEQHKQQQTAAAAAAAEDAPAAAAAGAAAGTAAEADQEESPVGELTGYGDVYHNVPLERLEAFLSGLHSLDGSTRQGAHLAASLCHSGSKQQGVVNVVLRRDKVPKNEAYRTTAQAPTLVQLAGAEAGGSRRPNGAKNIIDAQGLEEFAASDADARYAFKGSNYFVDAQEQIRLQCKCKLIT
jgi:hypothetical protein